MLDEEIERAHDVIRSLIKFGHTPQTAFKFFFDAMLKLGGVYPAMTELELFFKLEDEWEKKTGMER